MSDIREFEIVPVILQHDMLCYVRHLVLFLVLWPTLYFIGMCDYCAMCIQWSEPFGAWMLLVGQQAGISRASDL